MRRALLLVVTAALAAAAPAAAFTPTNPLANREWYLQDDHAFDAWPEPPTDLQPVKVAIVDSGIDCSLPDFAGRILVAKSFVGGNPCVDTEGHGTFVAGEIAANLGTNGIVGIAYTAQLLIAKVVTPDGTIPLQAEADAIRWSVDNGARVINLSLGGVRDPQDPTRDTYSTLEAQAVAYAYSKGAVLVAAVGNGDEAPSQPWPYASYPSALPHVIGVSALTRTGNVPDYSNRDPVFNDISAPGSSIFSTFPAALTALRVGCPDQGYSDCGTDDYRNAEGTSFAAPQVSAAAALLLATDPTLRPDQVTTLLERTAVDATPATGCNACAVGRDPLTGWGRLDIAAALDALAAGPLPPADTREPNDGTGSAASTIWGKTATIDATTDWWDDRIDVYRVYVRNGQLVNASVVGPSAPGASLALWRPGTVEVVGTSKRVLTNRLAVAGASGTLSYRSPVNGWYYLEVSARRTASGEYTLSIDKS